MKSYKQQREKTMNNEYQELLKKFKAMTAKELEQEINDIGETLNKIEKSIELDREQFEQQIKQLHQELDKQDEQLKLKIKQIKTEYEQNLQQIKQQIKQKYEPIYKGFEQRSKQRKQEIEQILNPDKQQAVMKLLVTKTTHTTYAALCNVAALANQFHCEFEVQKEDDDITSIIIIKSPELTDDEFGNIAEILDMADFIVELIDENDMADFILIDENEASSHGYNWQNGSGTSKAFPRAQS